MTVRNMASILALLGVLALAGCSIGTSTPQTAATPTPAATTAPPASNLELTFVGSDGNVWEMAWPGGTPKQWTTDATNQARYSGLAWSPDGANLAVLRETGPRSNPTGDTLVLFAPDGSKQKVYALIGQPYNTPFAWSPDASQIAYRTTTSRFDPNTGNIRGRLTIIDAQTGATKRTLLYDDGSGGCGGAFTPLQEAVIQAHNAYLGLDTFAWTPDGQGLLVSRGCGNLEAGLVNLGTGQTATGYPGGASYQPGGSGMMLGEWYNNASNTVTLGLANANGSEHSTLNSQTQQTNPVYITVIGQAAWSPDGQSVYFERDNGIWRVGADGSNAHQIIAGAPNDSQNQATVQTMPGVSPDGALLLYLQLQGANGDPGTGTAVGQCYVAQVDGSHAAPLPSGVSVATWRPVK